MKNISILLNFTIYILLSLLTINSFSQDAKIMVVGSIEVDDDKVAGASVTVMKNGVQYKKMAISETGKFALSVSFQDEYIFSFEKKGYVTKKIAISTKVPKGSLDDGLDPINFKIGLFKQYDGMNTVVFNQPVGHYMFDEKLDEFVYDTDYTKTIQSEIAKVEAEVKEKVKEEKILKKNQPVIDNTVNKTTPNNNTEQNEKIKAKAKEDEERRKKEEEKNKLSKEAKAKSDEESKKMLLATKAEEDAKKQKEAKAREEDMERRFKEAKAKGEEEMRKLLTDAKMKSYLSKIYPEGITIEKIKDQWKEITRIIVNRKGICNIFSDVKHSWGGKFYFRNNETISQHVYSKETKPMPGESVYNKAE